MKQQESVLKFGKIVALVVAFVYLVMGMAFAVMITWVSQPFQMSDGIQANFYLVRIISAMCGFFFAALFLPRVLCWIGQCMQAVGQWMRKCAQRMQEAK